MRRADGQDWQSNAEQFRAYYEHLPNCDLERDVVVAETAAGIVGYGRVEPNDQHDGRRVYVLIAFADLSSTSASAAIAGIVDALTNRARQLAAQHLMHQAWLRIPVGGRADVLDKIVRDRGFEPVRYSFLMVRPGLDDLPHSPLPDGLELRPVQTDQLRVIWEAGIEAFRDHWGTGEVTEADWENFLTELVIPDMDLWRVAWDGDRVAGMVRCYSSAAENAQFGRGRLWLDHISVLRPWRRRGLARALIAASFPVPRARGLTEAALTVDTENLTGALRLYESCGFLATERSAIFERSLA
jgi:ribosomal protein S18 acetylase RimI-like enzyme